MHLVPIRPFSFLGIVGVAGRAGGLVRQESQSSHARGSSSHKQLRMSGYDGGRELLWGSLQTLLIHVLKSYLPMPPNVTAFADRDLKEVIKLK